MNELGRWIAQAGDARPRISRPRWLALRRHGAAPGPGRRLGSGLVFSVILHAALVGVFVRVADAPQGMMLEAFPMQVDTAPVLVASISSAHGDVLDRRPPQDEARPSTPRWLDTLGPTSEARSRPREPSPAPTRGPSENPVGSLETGAAGPTIREAPAELEQGTLKRAPRVLVWAERSEPPVERETPAREDLKLVLPRPGGPAQRKPDLRNAALPRLVRGTGPDLSLAHLDAASYGSRPSDTPPGAQLTAIPKPPETAGARARTFSFSASSGSREPGTSEAPPGKLIAAQPLTPVRPESDSSAAPPERALAQREVNPATPPSVAAPPPGSPVGLGFGKLRVRLEGPRVKVTERNVETISGRISGGPATRLVLQVNEATSEVISDGQSFQVAVSLRGGVNLVRAVVTDWRGSETEDTITVEYVPPAVAGGIAITSPKDGHTLSPEDPPLVAIEGQVEDRKAQTVWLVVNEQPISARVTDGRFRQVLPVLDTVVRVWAEIPANGGPPQRSQTVTILSATPGAPTGTAVMDWAQLPGGLQAEVAVTWRATPERVDAPVQTVSVKALGASPNGTLGDALYLRNLRPGVYTFVLRYRASESADLLPTLLFPKAGALSLRSLGPVTVNGSGKVVLARILLPHGVFWEQDEWFSGQSQSADTVTKFRVPGGITWTELKRDLR